LITESKKLLNKGGGFSKGIRLLGLTVSNFMHDEIAKPVQLVIEF
jgi:DNA polymerase-4